MIKITYGRQDIQDSDISAVLEVLRSDFLTQGPAVPYFESVVGQHCGASHALAVNSATSALHMALMALEVGKGDIVWTSPNSFVASANAVLYCGAKVDFVDIDLVTYNMCVSALEIKLKNAEKINQLPKVVIPVHFAGQPCDLEKIYALSKRFGFRVVEDASHAIGGEYKGRPIGNCEYSDITVFSFHPVKIITTAEGGVAVTNNKHLAQKMALYRNHGLTRDPEQMTHKPDGPWYYQQIALGYNFRMTDLQAALGASQMQRLGNYVEKRHSIAEYYDKELKDLPLILPAKIPGNYSALHLYVIRLEENSSPKLTHHKVFEALHACGVLVNVHYIPIHTQPYYQKMGFRWGDFPNSEHYYKTAMSIPMFPTLSKKDQAYVVDALKRIFK